MVTSLIDDFHDRGAELVRLVEDCSQLRSIRFEIALPVIVDGRPFFQALKETA